MARERRPNLATGLLLFIVGAILVGYVLYTNGLSSGLPVQQIWPRLSIGSRAGAVAGFIACAYGLGALVSNLTRKN